MFLEEGKFSLHAVYDGCSCPYRRFLKFGSLLPLIRTDPWMLPVSMRQNKWGNRSIPGRGSAGDRGSGLWYRIDRESCKDSRPGFAVCSRSETTRFRPVDTGLPAGPSESIIIADPSADPRLVALDLLIEAEHGSASAALLVTPELALAEEVKKILGLWADQLPEPRRTFVQDVFAHYGGILVTESLDEAVQVVNQFAPEHLQLQVSNPLDLLVRSSTPSRFSGFHYSFRVANYGRGANAVLPTGGRAVPFAVSVRDFLKYSSVILLLPGDSLSPGPVQIIAE
jgi:hypothetical protein